MWLTCVFSSADADTVVQYPVRLILTVRNQENQRNTNDIIWLLALRSASATAELFETNVDLRVFFFFFPFFLAGIIRTALANMDREAREHYTVVIQAKDMAGQVGGLSGSTTINITLSDINDNPPKFPQSMCTVWSK